MQLLAEHLGVTHEPLVRVGGPHVDARHDAANALVDFRKHARHDCVRRCAVEVLRHHAVQRARLAHEVLDSLARRHVALQRRIPVLCRKRAAVHLHAVGHDGHELRMNLKLVLAKVALELVKLVEEHTLRRRQVLSKQHTQWLLERNHERERLRRQREVPCRNVLQTGRAHRARAQHYLARARVELLEELDNPAQRLGSKHRQVRHEPHIAV